MPKIKKQGRLRSNRNAPFYNELINDINPSRGVKPPKCLPQEKRVSADYDDLNIVDADTSSRILRMAAEQQEDDDESMEGGEHKVQEDGEDAGPPVDNMGYTHIDSHWCDIETEETERFVLKASGDRSEQRTLADLIMEKIREKERREATREVVAEESSGPDHRVVQVYTEVGKYLAKYKSGKLPKAFKIIPRIKNWEEILFLTDPVNWTPNSMYEATRIFASNFSPKMAQKFYNLVLLPAARDDISRFKKLNVHYYEALKKALFKPAAWFKGILLPLLLDSCTLREAIIFGSILSRVSVPPIHVAAALIRVCDLHNSNPLEWSAATSYILCIMLNKKCALPVSAVTACVNHFNSFASDGRQLPVVWHRALLTLVQHYKFDLSAQQRDTIENILKSHTHSSIGPEIKSELRNAQLREWL